LENCSDDVKIYIVGNKCDLETERKVSHEDGKEKADELKNVVAFFETSAIDGKKSTINELFSSVIKELKKMPRRSTGMKL
jgi:GTPase SAR1 family protein